MATPARTAAAEASAVAPTAVRAPNPTIYARSALSIAALTIRSLASRHASITSPRRAHFFSMMVVRSKEYFLPWHGKDVLQRRLTLGTSGSRMTEYNLDR